MKPDLVFYQGGIDPIYSDRLGQLDISRNGLRARNQIVYMSAIEHGKPLVITVGIYGMYVFTYVCIYMYVCMNVMYEWIYRYICLYVCWYVCMYVYMYVYTYVRLKCARMYELYVRVCTYIFGYSTIISFKQKWKAVYLFHIEHYEQKAVFI